MSKTAAENNKTDTGVYRWTNVACIAAGGGIAAAGTGASLASFFALLILPLRNAILDAQYTDTGRKSKSSNARTMTWREKIVCTFKYFF